MELARFLSMIFTPALTSAARPGLTFAVIQLLAAGLVRLDLLTISDGLLWLVSLPTVAIGLVLGLAETWAHHDPDVAGLLRDLKIDYATGAFGAFSAALLFSSLGLPEAEAMRLADPSAGEVDLSFASQIAVSADQSVELRIAALVGAVSINGGLIWLRGKIMDVLYDLELSRPWAWFETGGIAAALLLLPFLPVLMLMLVLISTLALLMIGTAIHVIERASDRIRRSPCPSCGSAVRVEASRCVACKGVLTPSCLLGQPGQLRRGWQRGLAELRALRRRAAVRMP